MSKFLYFQDFHIKAKNSINRIGDYFSDALIKFDELLSIAKENKVDAILDGGDMLDSPEPSYRVLDEIADRVEKVGIPIYSLFGNHAERYHSMEHSKYTGLAHLQKRSQYFKYLKKVEGKDFVICGLEYSHNVEEELTKDGWQFIPDFYKDFWKILIAHAFICPESFPYASHVICDDIKTNTDIVLVAHYHKAWEKKVGDTQFIDIGCFGRNSITEANIVPKCILLDTDKRSYEIIPIKSSKAPSLVFNLEKYNEEKVKEVNLDEFIQALESTNFQGLRIDQILDNMLKAGQITKDVVQLIKGKIEGLKHE